ncbi:TPA: KilA-N domain-containing protein [Providencia alcalifaciens]
MINKLPIVVGVEIPLDEHGRYNLNSLHKASGEGENKEPNQWLRTKQAKELITQLKAKLLKTNLPANMQVAQNVINVVKGGVSPGVFAHELIAVSYAGWIRPDFQLDVNQAFIDFKSGNAELKLPTLSHMSGEFETLRNKLVLDEKEESALLTQCARIMNARKKTKSKRQRLMDALKDAG